MNAFLRYACGTPAARSFRDLLVWRKAHEFVLAVYRFTESFPDAGDLRAVAADAASRRFHPGQYRRRVPARGKADKARFMNMAEGSVEECRYYLILAQDLGYGEHRVLMRTLEEVSRMLNAYAAAILASDS